ncbi:hypothetical protein [Microcoleus sp. herbarium2]|uniref:hypothetical protein n=1 Tax=Microcoleus sp. herbarium2 TaxID=3055433 RepID=UPI002FD4976A
MEKGFILWKQLGNLQKLDSSYSEKRLKIFNQWGKLFDLDKLEADNLFKKSDRTFQSSIKNQGAIALHSINLSRG